MPNLEALVSQVRQGNQNLREVFIAEHKDFIHRYACFICKARLDWQNDDELSIAMIAFNKAIDTFDASHGKGFLGYARLLIKNGLIDFFRAEDRIKRFNRSGGREMADPVASETTAAWDCYLRELENRERAYEIELFEEAIAGFGLTVEDLATSSPRHQDTREKLKEAAQKISREPEIVMKMRRLKKLPVTEIQLATGLSRKTIEKWRSYLVSLVLILSESDMEELAEYIRGKGGRPVG